MFAVDPDRRYGSRRGSLPEPQNVAFIRADWRNRMATRRIRLFIGILIGVAVGAVHAFVSYEPPPFEPVGTTRALAVVDREGNVLAVVPIEAGHYIHPSSR